MKNEKGFTEKEFELFTKDLVEASEKVRQRPFYFERALRKSKVRRKEATKILHELKRLGFWELAPYAEGVIVLGWLNFKGYQTLRPKMEL